MSACVRFEGVTHAFGSGPASTPVLSDVDLAFGERRTTAIVGESGSGKSTLLKMVNGLLVPDRGRVEVFGAPVDPGALVALRRRIGYAVQGSALFPHLSVDDNVTLLARFEGWDAARIAGRTAHLFDLMELPRALGARFPHELSGGQQQRAALCRAMMLEPPLLLLDEPFSAVDPITRAGIHEHFERLARTEDVSVVLVTHDLHEAITLADDLVVLGEGRVLQADTVDAVRAAPAAPWIDRLLETQR